MSHDQFTPEEQANGRTELAAALADFARHGLTGQPPTGTPAGDTRHYCKPSNLEALVVAHRPGGWTAHVLFRSMPPGQPTCVGTRDPRPTYREAMLEGREILETLLAVAQASFYLDGAPCIRA